MQEITIQHINNDLNGITPYPDLNNLNQIHPKIEGTPPVDPHAQKQIRQQKRMDRLKQYLGQNKLKIGIGVGIFVVVIIVLGVVLGVLLRNKNEGNGANTQPNYPIIGFTCQQQPSECQGVPQVAQSYILSNYQQPNQIRSLLQVSRTMATIQQNMTNKQYKGRNDQSAECLAYNLAHNSSQAYQNLFKLQFSTTENLAAYFSMNEQFSGQPISLTPTQSLAATCQFSLSPTSTSSLRSTSAPLSTSATCNSGNSSLIYFDGIGYGPNHAVNNLQKIYSAIQESQNIRFGSMITVGAWRTDNGVGFLVGIILAYQQKLLQNNQTPPSQIDLYNCLSIILESASLAVRLPASITRQTFKRFLQFFKEYITNQMINSILSYNVQRHKQFVTQQINQGKKVVLVAHAEGSLYANAVYNLLNSTYKQYVSLVYVAPISSSMADGSANYITNPSDYVNLAIQLFATLSGQFSPPLSANVQAKTFREDLDFGFNHQLAGYVQAYKTNFIALIYTSKQRANQPTANLGAGPITVQLNWDSQPDIDLHIFEPLSSHVYYAHMRGITGYLDRDDTTGYGPQHYYTDCSNLKEGDYVVRLNFFSGFADSRATVTVSAGPEFIMKSLTIAYPPSGSGGNALPPYYICTISVQLNNNTNSYVYRITQ